MPFPLSRGGSNVIAEVQRWQYFLLKQGFLQVGPIDGDFGLNTETATKFFQVKVGVSSTGALDRDTLAAAGALGYKILPDNHYRKLSEKTFPEEPEDLTSPSNESRNRDFGCFKFVQLPRAQRPDAEAIVIRGRCDASAPDWVASSIVSMEVPQLKFARGFGGRIRCHTRAAPIIKALFEKWEAEDLLHLIMSYEGCFVPRYKRRQAPPGSSGHGEKKSSNVPKLSNHSFGSAFDINFTDNQLGEEPARCGMRGSVRELVAAANSLGVFWGGHFGTKDGMHFEISKLT